MNARCSDRDTDGVRCGDLDGHDGAHSWHESVERVWGLVGYEQAKRRATLDDLAGLRAEVEVYRAEGCRCGERGLCAYCRTTALRQSQPVRF